MLTLKNLLTWAVLATPAVTLPSSIPVDINKIPQKDIESGLGLAALQAVALAKSLELARKNPAGGCTIDKIKYRREW